MAYISGGSASQLSQSVSETDGACPFTFHVPMNILKKFEVRHSHLLFSLLFQTRKIYAQSREFDSNTRAGLDCIEILIRYRIVCVYV